MTQHRSAIQEHGKSTTTLSFALASATATASFASLTLLPRSLPISLPLGTFERSFLHCCTLYCPRIRLSPFTIRTSVINDFIWKMRKVWCRLVSSLFFGAISKLAIFYRATDPTKNSVLTNAVFGVFNCTHDAEMSLGRSAGVADLILEVNV